MHSHLHSAAGISWAHNDAGRDTPAYVTPGSGNRIEFAITLNGRDIPPDVGNSLTMTVNLHSERIRKFRRERGEDHLRTACKRGRQGPRVAWLHSERDHSTNEPLPPSVGT